MFQVVEIICIAIQVENALLSLDWNGVEEREELEGRRTKLTAQLDEAIALKVVSNKTFTYLEIGKILKLSRLYG